MVAEMLNVEILCVSDVSGGYQGYSEGLPTTKIRSYWTHLPDGDRLM